MSTSLHNVKSPEFTLCELLSVEIHKKYSLQITSSPKYQLNHRFWEIECNERVNRDNACKIMKNNS